MFIKAEKSLSYRVWKTVYSPKRIYTSTMLYFYHILTLHNAITEKGGDYQLAKYLQYKRGLFGVMIFRILQNLRSSEKILSIWSE